METVCGGVSQNVEGMAFLGAIFTESVLGFFCRFALYYFAEFQAILVFYAYSLEL